ncbi:MAG: hypothetical protein WCO66_03310 [Candidatus Absconditabacteria bacterium]
MNTPGGISKVTHDGSREDIILHFNEHEHHSLFQYIGFKTSGEKNTDDEIKKIMISIGKKNQEIGFEEYRKSKPRGLSYEDAGHLINTVLIYNKGVKKIKDAAIMDIIDNHCTLALPDYLKTITTHTIEQKLLTDSSQKTYKFLRKKIRNIVDFFYNFRMKYTEEQRERDLEDNDKDDTYTPKRETAFDKTYKEFFKAIDPQQKFQKENEEVIGIFFAIIKAKEDAKNEPKQKIAKTEAVELKTKNLKDNTNPEFQEVDEDGDVIGLTADHTPGWKIPNPPRLNDPFG